MTCWHFSQERRTHVPFMIQHADTQAAAPIVLSQGKTVMLWKLKNIDGFTLIEVLIALFVFTIGFLGFVGLFTNLITVNSTNDYKMTATSLAQQEMENIKRRPFDKFSTYTNKSLSTNPGFKLTTSKASFGSVSTAIVTAQVLWKNNTKSVQLQTIIVK